MKKTVVSAALLSCAVFAVGPALATHAWGHYHWARTNNPLPLRVVDAVDGQWDSYLDTAVSDWSASKVIYLIEQPGTGISPKKCTAITGKALACNAAYGQRGWLGLATIWANGDHITKATLKLNDTYFSWATYNTPAWRRLVTCQELAHDFGLDHQDENFDNANLGTCMDYTSDPDGPPSNEHPNAHDYEELEIIYAHLDTFNSYSTSTSTNFGIRNVGAQPVGPAARDDEAGDSPAEWGAAIHYDRQGRPDVFVKQLGQGNKKITHVFWAIGKGPDKG